MTILGLETSCDETAAAIVRDGTQVLATALATSLAQHEATGGIVPEVASRAQSAYILPVIQDVMTSLDPADIDAIAVTQGPGLIGSLLVGVETAKALAYGWHKPLIAVNHMVGHLYAAWLTDGDAVNARWPKLALLVSGGHTELILMRSHADLVKVGWTVDDAAGEAFDKVAKLLALGYPGGPALSRAALTGDSSAIPFPQPMPGKDNVNFSFSGLKTAAYHYIQAHPEASTNDIAASFQHTVVRSLVTKTLRAATHYGVKEILLGGGVAANTSLRQTLVDQSPIPVRVPDLTYTTDNAAMIAAAAYFNPAPANPLTLKADPSLEIPLIT